MTTWQDVSAPDSVSTWHLATAWNSGPSADTGPHRVEIHGLEDLPERVQDEP
ncbi:MAG: hypothetical protein K6T78_15420 [Alicyclobacillus sp.]|nr:hypothetical protein [Alicyclobacillus sp.]